MTRQGAGPTVLLLWIGGCQAQHALLFRIESLRPNPTSNPEPGGIAAVRRHGIALLARAMALADSSVVLPGRLRTVQPVLCYCG